MMTRLSCEEVIEKLFEFLDHEVSEAAQVEIERHLEVCRSCFSRAEFERRLRAHVATAAEVKAPERLRRRIRLLTARY